MVRCELFLFFNIEFDVTAASTTPLEPASNFPILSYDHNKATK
jgi:hypothetical protein